MNRPTPAGGVTDPVHDLWLDGQEVWRDGRYMTELITEQAVGYLQDAVARDQLFFLYVAYNAPHYPMHAPAEYMQRFAHLPWDRQVMAAMLAAADDGVGAITAELDRLGVRQDTCVFFTSDNGPSRETRNWLDGTADPYYGGSAGGLRGYKGSLYEGGIRVPGIVSWPGRIDAGQVLDGPCATMDVFPTVLAAADGDVSQYGADGVDILPYLADGAAPPQRDLFWERPTQTAVRRGSWKLVLDDGVPHLFDLASDVSEQHDVRDKHPQLAAELASTATTWRHAVTS